MPINTPEDSGERSIGVDWADFERYVHLSLRNGDTVIYDRANADAWLQSGDGVGLGVMR